jgi:CP family cyanate transporter-like MFS transporter
MSNTVAGVLTTLPFICMGAFAFLGPPLIRRFGTRAVLSAALALIGVGTVVRAAMGTPALLIVATLPVGLGIALAGVAIPIVIKQYYPRRPGAATGAYTTAMAIGIAVVGLTAVPLASALGGWREAFAISALPALVALPLWILARVDDHRTEAVSAGPESDLAEGRMRISGTGIYLGALFGLQSLCFAAVMAWGPAVYEDAGWSAASAGLVITVTGLMTIVASLTVPWLSDRGERRTWLVAMTLVMCAGLAGMAIAPGTLGLAWMVLFGFGSGAVLPLCFALPHDFGRTPAQAGMLTAWMLGIGHSTAALGPTMTGAVRDLSGGFGVPVAILCAIGLIDAGLALALPRRD